MGKKNIVGDKEIVNHPSHYTAHPSGVECVELAEHLCFNLGNALKYVWRAGKKGAKQVDLEKALWYVDRESSLIDQSESHKIFQPGAGEEIFRVIAAKVIDADTEKKGLLSDVLLAITHRDDPYGMLGLLRHHIMMRLDETTP